MRRYINASKPFVYINLKLMEQRAKDTFWNSRVFKDKDKKAWQKGCYF